MKKSNFIRKPKSVRIAADDGEDDKPKRVTIKEDTVKKEGNEGKQGTGGVGRNLPGCRVSVLTGKPMISTGHAFIDNAFGGGITIGHLGLIEEDVNTTYYNVLFSLFIAQSLSLPLPQHCLLISPFPDQFSTLPKPMNYSESANSSVPKEQLKIAWRYDNIQEKSNPSGTRREPFSNVFDLHKQMDLSPERLSFFESVHLDKLRENDTDSTSSLPFLNNLLHTIQQKIEFCQKENIVLRIILHSFGSPFWFNNSSYQTEKEILRFLHRLKGVLRSSTAVCLFSTPTHLFTSSFKSKLQRVSDISCNFQSFKGESDAEVDLAFKDYDGHFNVDKLPRVDSLTRHLPDTISYVFARKRHKLIVEVFSLPPEMTRTTESAQSQNVTKLLCQTGPTKQSDLDF